MPTGRAFLGTVLCDGKGSLNHQGQRGCKLRPDAFIPAQVMCRAIDPQMRADFIFELPTVILQMLTLELMPSLNAQDVRDVDVSILLPRTEISGL